MFGAVVFCVLFAIHYLMLNYVCYVHKHEHNNSLPNSSPVWNHTLHMEGTDTVKIKTVKNEHNYKQCSNWGKQGYGCIYRGRCGFTFSCLGSVAETGTITGWGWVKCMPERMGMEE